MNYDKQISWNAGLQVMLENKEAWKRCTVHWVKNRMTEPKEQWPVASVVPVGGQLQVVLPKLSIGAIPF